MYAVVDSRMTTGQDTDIPQVISIPKAKLPSDVCCIVDGTQLRRPSRQGKLTYATSIARTLPRAGHLSPHAR